MKPGRLAIMGAAALGAFLFTAPAATAHAQCPAGTLQVGVEERRVGNVIYEHPVCEQVASPDLRDAPNDGQTVVQLNPAAESAEARDIAAQRRQPCPPGTGTAFGDLQRAAGGEPIGCVMDGGRDAARTARVLSRAELNWYNQVPGFRAANATLTRARAAHQAAQRARESLDRQIAAAAANTPARSELESRRRAAAQTEDTARGACVIADNALEVIIRQAGTPIIRAAPRQPRP